jgi:haloacetate dehalogenase
MAVDEIAVMRTLGFHRFTVVGHDCGGRIAYRIALDPQT